LFTHPAVQFPGQGKQAYAAGAYNNLLPDVLVEFDPFDPLAVAFVPLDPFAGGGVVLLAGADEEANPA